MLSTETKLMTRLIPVPSEETSPISRCAVIGTGLVGGSIALAAKRAGFRVTVYDSDTATITKAHAKGLHVALSAADGLGGAKYGKVI